MKNFSARLEHLRQIKQGELDPNFTDILNEIRHLWMCEFDDMNIAIDNSQVLPQFKDEYLKKAEECRGALLKYERWLEALEIPL